jgi:hypothetical protein
MTHSINKISNRNSIGIYHGDMLVYLFINHTNWHNHSVCYVCGYRMNTRLISILYGKD